MTHYYPIETKFIHANATPSARQGYWVMGDDEDEKGRSFIRATRIKYGERAKGDGIFPYFKPEALKTSLQVQEGFKAPSTGWANAHVRVEQDGAIVYSNALGKLVFDYFKPKGLHGAMSLKRFLQTITGGHRKEIRFDDNNDGITDTTVTYTPSQKEPHKGANS
ncbi:MAG: hypothetical protein ACKO37_03120 [Vampirovibrionales bacterium]